MYCTGALAWKILKTPRGCNNFPTLHDFKVNNTNIMGSLEVKNVPTIHTFRGQATGKIIVIPLLAVSSLFFSKTPRKHAQIRRSQIGHVCEPLQFDPLLHSVDAQEKFLRVKANCRKINDSSQKGQANAGQSCHSIKCPVK